MKAVSFVALLTAATVSFAAAAVAAQQNASSKPTPTATIPAKSEDDHAASAPMSDRIEHTWIQTKALTAKEWNAAKRKWAAEKVKWRACNRQAEAERLAAPKSWSFVVRCMAGPSTKISRQ